LYVKKNSAAAPLIISIDGKPVAALSAVGSGLQEKTLPVLLNMLDFNMDLKQAIFGTIPTGTSIHATSGI
jgi:gamma-glutamyltranspeptidase